jgi:hypothetical protein
MGTSFTSRPVRLVLWQAICGAVPRDGVRHPRVIDWYHES